jgi:hypothetical protein
VDGLDILIGILQADFAISKQVYEFVEVCSCAKLWLGVRTMT